MSGNKCEYLNCGKNKRLNSDLKFHIFPKNENLCKKWILHSGNIKLDDLSPKTLRKKFICENHFENDMYMCMKRQRLIPSAVPKLYHNIEEFESNNEHQLDSTQTETHLKSSKRKLLFDEDLSLTVDDNNTNMLHYSNIVSTSGTFIVTPDKIKVLTPTKKYTNLKSISSPQLIFPSPNSISSDSSRTKQWVQELCQLPSPTITKRVKLNNEQLINICKRQKKIINRKRAIIAV
ncbi:uncharacterized protein LOC126554792 [Aphis gossypii]|uniref:uncharacterized protein LOC126554792 n=1 Tax=Aphis gossypii TaxID=80765 RepID=UPI0021599CAA|nr:uncharacterized protein LOC126554792 [Aphis gossypii]